jgi:phage gp37-like protein
MTHEFEQLEDAALAALAPLKTAVGIRTIEPYAGQLEVDDIHRITIRFPCVYVIADGMKVSRRNNAEECVMSLMLLIGDKNYRSNQAAARGDASTPGVYEILKAARDVLHRKKLLPLWVPAVLISEEPQVYQPVNGLCLYTAVYEVRIHRKL